MMPSEKIPPPSHPPDHHHNHNATTRKQPPKTTQEQPQPPPPKCPRCDSSNTKFCYYNNYSLTQPRYFCKTCRRYWTKGGALRNVPIGGGCRKTKKHKPSPSSSSCPTPSAASASEFRFLAPPPSMDFHLGGLPLPKLHPATAGVFTHFIAKSGAHQPPPLPLPISMGPTTTGSCFSLDLVGTLSNYAPVPNSGNSTPSNSSSLTLAGGGEGGGGGDRTFTISSIESLSTINQEMHWKLQQQRLALIYGPSSIMEQNDGSNNNNNHHHLHQQEERTLLGGVGEEEIELYKNMETNRKQLDVVAPTTEWLFDQIHQTNSSTVNYGVADHNNNNANNVVGVTTTNNTNNQHEVFNNGVWTTELHHHQHYNGMQ